MLRYRAACDTYIHIYIYIYIYIYITSYVQDELATFARIMISFRWILLLLSYIWTIRWLSWKPTQNVQCYSQIAEVQDWIRQLPQNISNKHRRTCRLGCRRRCHRAHTALSRRTCCRVRLRGQSWRSCSLYNVHVYVVTFNVMSQSTVHSNFLFIDKQTITLRNMHMENGK